MQEILSAWGSHVLQYGPPLQLDSISLLTLFSCSPSILLSSGCRSKASQTWKFKQDIFPSVLETGSPWLRCELGWFLVRPLFPACRWPLSPCVLSRPSLPGVSLRALSPSVWPHSTIGTSLKALTANTVTCWGPTSYGFWNRVYLKTEKTETEFSCRVYD